jgi:hypothetical protein
MTEDRQINFNRLISAIRSRIVLSSDRERRVRRRIDHRLLAWTPSLTTLFRLHDSVSQLLRC